MRKLQTSDIFAAARTAKAIGIKDEIKAMAMKANKIQDITREDIGFDFLFSVLDKVIEANGEQELYKFLAIPFECEPKEIEQMDPVEMMQKVVEVAEPEKWKSFFSSVARLMTLN